MEAGEPIRGEQISRHKMAMAWVRGGVRWDGMERATGDGENWAGLKGD